MQETGYSAATTMMVEGRTVHKSTVAHCTVQLVFNSRDPKSNDRLKRVASLSRTANCSNTRQDYSSEAVMVTRHVWCLLGVYGPLFFSKQGSWRCARSLALAMFLCQTSQLSSCRSSLHESVPSRCCAGQLTAARLHRHLLQQPTLRAPWLMQAAAMGMRLMLLQAVAMERLLLLLLLQATAMELLVVKPAAAMELLAVMQQQRPQQVAAMTIAASLHTCNGY